MRCPVCGKEQGEGSRFCTDCGAPLRNEISIPDGIFYCDDGKFRWIYEINLWKKNVIAGSLIKVFSVVIFLVLAPLLFITGLINGGIYEAVSGVISVVPISVLVCAVLVLVGYVITAIINGGKYCAVFTMDNEKIVHSQSHKQVDRGRILALLSTLASRDIVNGMMVLAGEKFTSSYKDVKSVKLEKKHNLIRVNSVAVKNQIYADSRQFDFVADYIIKRCPGAEIKRG